MRLSDIVMHRMRKNPLDIATTPKTNMEMRSHLSNLYSILNVMKIVFCGKMHVPM